MLTRRIDRARIRSSYPKFPPVNGFLQKYVIIREIEWLQINLLGYFPREKSISSKTCALSGGSSGGHHIECKLRCK